MVIDLKEIGPTYYFAPPRVFEGLLTSVMIRMEDAGAVKRWMFRVCMDVAKRICGDKGVQPIDKIDRVRAADDNRSDPRILLFKCAPIEPRCLLPIAAAAG